MEDLGPLEMAEPAVERRIGPDGTIYLRSPQPLGACPPHLGVWLERWAHDAPERIFLQERSGDHWRRLSYREVAAKAAAWAEALLELGLGPDRPLMALSGNSVDQALLMLAAHLAGIPWAPLSPAYSLLSRDFGKLRHAVSRVRPGALFVDAAAPFRAALAALDGQATTLLLTGQAEDVAWQGPRQTLAALDRPPGSRLAAARATLGPGSVAKILFTSGSTGMPKGVINTHGMLCANQQMIAQVWPFLHREPPLLVDWLPWNHCFGANHNFNMVLAHGGTLVVDRGKPLPGMIDETVRTLREVSPTLYFNVPAGFAQLLPYLERDAALRHTFFRALRLIFYAGAALPQDSWQRLERLAIAELGRPVAMVSAWGSTETSPAATTVHFPISRAGVIGLPLPGVDLKMVPNGGKLELRVRGPLVMPGYLGEDDLTQAAFDEEGFYRIGDAGRFVDDQQPELGIVFDGRVAEDFKLASGTWVSVGALRVAIQSACPLLQDVVLAGHDQPDLSLLAWLNAPRCQALLAEAGTGGAVDLAMAELVEHPTLRQAVERALRAFNQEQPGRSTRIARVLLLAEPPSIDLGELTDKGYINQRATLENRAAEVAKLYATPLAPEILDLG